MSAEAGLPGKMAVIGHSFLSIIIGQHWTWNTPASARFPSTCWLKSKAAREGRREGAENKVGPIIRMSYLDKKKRFSNFAEILLKIFSLLRSPVLARAPH